MQRFEALKCSENFRWRDIFELIVFLDKIKSAGRIKQVNILYTIISSTEGFFKLNGQISENKYNKHQIALNY